MLTSKPGAKKARRGELENADSDIRLKVGPESVTNNVDVSDYERIRLENIRRNESFLSTLGLDEVRPAIEAPINKTGKLQTKKGLDRKKLVCQMPARRSGRVTIDRLKAEEIEKAEGVMKEEKKELLKEMESKNIDMSYEAELIEYEAAFVNRRIVDDTIELVSATNTPHFVTDVKSWYRPMLNSFSLSQSLYSSQSHQLTSGVTVAYTKKMNKLKLAEEDLAKLTDHRITSIWLHNSTDKIIAAAGDKVGNLGIWDVDFTGTQGSSQGGIYKYRPHVEGITRLHSWPSDHTKLYSVSSDGTIRYLDVVKEVFALGFTAPENINDVSFLDACFNEDGNTVLLGRADGKVSLVDFRSRTSSSGYEWTIEVYAGSRVNSVQQHPTNASLMVTAGGGTCGYIAVHDIRKPGGGNKLKTVHELREHTKSINAAYVSPNGQFIVSVSQDNTVKACSADFTDTTSNPVVCTLPHDNHTGVWLSTFRPTFDPKSDSAFVLGSMDRPRRIEVFNPQKEGDNDFAISLLANLQSCNLRSVCSRNCFHRSLDVIAGGNSSGRVHILR